MDKKALPEGDRVNVDRYSYPTDTQRYLLPGSCHPKHYCRNIPYSLALRLKCICIDNDTFDLEAAKELSEQLSNRGYRKSNSYRAIERVRTQVRNELLVHKPKPEAPFILTYHYDLPKANHIVQKH